MLFCLKVLRKSSSNRKSLTSTVSNVDPNILGCRNVMYQCPMPLVSAEITSHKTFMDTIGRTTLKLTAMNLVDESRDRDIIVTYDYPFMAAYRKPITIFAGIMAVFLTAWGIGRLDVSIAKPS